MHISNASAVLALSLPVSSSHSPPTPRPWSAQTNDRQIIDLLATVHDRGKDLFNTGDHAGGYRLFQGSLATIRLVLLKELQDSVDQGLSRASREADNARRALVLHEVIEDVRKKLHPTAGPSEKLGPPRKAMTDSDGVPKAPAVELPMIPSNVVETPEPPKASPVSPKPKDDLPAPPPIIQATPTKNPKPSKPMSPPDAPDALTVPPRPATLGLHPASCPRPSRRGIARIAPCPRL